MAGVPQGPYVGLRAYGTGDADLFFGRDREAYDVRVLWMGNRLTVLYGPSGVGKTSLVNAGVRARFGSGTADVLPLARISQTSAVPSAALPEHNPYTFALLSSWAPHEPATLLSDLTIAGYLRQRLRPAADADADEGPLPVLAAVDRFEEVFSDFPHRRGRYLDEFIGQLGDAVREHPRLRLLIAIREDSLASLLQYEAALSGDSRTRFRLLPLRRPAALESVTKPLEGTGRFFAEGVAEKLVDDLRTTEITNSIGQTTRIEADAVEPVHLQVVCSALWNALPAQTTRITEDDLRDHGDVDRTLADFLADAVAAVSVAHGVPEARLRDWLERTFITEIGTRNTVYEGASLTAGMPNAVARAFEDQHILRREWRSRSQWYELLHDRLIEPIKLWNARPPAHLVVPEGSPADYLRTAEGALSDGELGLAWKHAQEALRLAADDPRTQAEAQSFLGNVAFEDGRIDVAETHYRLAAQLFEVLQDSTAVGMLLKATGELMLSTGRYLKAAEDLGGAVRRLPSDLRARMELARALRLSGQLRGADGVLGMVLAQAPDATDALAARGELRVELGDDAAALDDLANVARLRPEAAARPSVRSARALALARSGRLDEALAEATAAVAAAPDSGPVLARAAAVAALASPGERDSRDRAAALLRRALAATDPALAEYQRVEAERLRARLGPDAGGGAPGLA